MQIDGQDISLDPTASKEVTGLVNEASRPQSNYTAGNSQARGLLNRADGFNDQLAYGNGAESAAIRSRYSQAYNRSEYDLNTKMMQNASLDKIKKLQTVSALANEEVETNKQKEILKHKIEQANKRARGAIIGTVLGIAGGAAGAYLTKSPEGASAGYAMGEGTGNLIGSS